MRLGVSTAEALEGAARMASILRGGEPPDGSVHCWWCGTEPELVEISTLTDAQPRYVPGLWPPGDHAHAVQPPTPGQLEQAGHDTLMRIHREA